MALNGLVGADVPLTYSFTHSLLNEVLKINTYDNTQNVHSNWLFLRLPQFALLN